MAATLSPGAVLWHDDDKPLAAHHCIVVRTADAGIVRIDEYVDPTLLAQLGVAEPKEVSP
jgi:ketosteroid isomerase-like protein